MALKAPILPSKFAGISASRRLFGFSGFMSSFLRFGARGVKEKEV